MKKGLRMSTLASKISQFAGDADKLHQVVHGPADGPGSTVSTDGGEIPSLARGAAAFARADVAAQEAMAARDAAILNSATYPDEPTGRAAVADGEYFRVAGSGMTALQLYRRTSDSTSELITRFASIAAYESLKTAQGKNLLDKSKIRAGRYYSNSSNGITISSVYRCSDFIPVEQNQAYRVSGVKAGMSGGWFAAASDTAGLAAAGVITNGAITAPAGAKYLVINLTNDAALTYDSTAQVELGINITAYEPYTPMINPADIAGGARVKSEAITAEDMGGSGAETVLEIYSDNMIDPASVDFSRRYSTGTKGFVSDALKICASAYIPVREGEFYTVSGDAIFGLPTATGCQGGYFTASGAPTAIANISFFAPVTGPGATFQVPVGQGITHVVISLDEDATGLALDGQAQMEQGEMATVYQPYAAKTRVRPEFIPGMQDIPTAPTATFDDAAWYRYTQGEALGSYSDKLPLFRKSWLLQDRDLCVVNTGTSLTARSIEHCTEHPQAATRPPLMHSRNFASHIWDRLRWQGQQYRRYDSGAFIETGVWATASDMAEWDDGVYRSGLTRYASGAASVQFTVPINAYQFNLIYRTDSVDTTAATISIAEGTGKMQVLNDSGVWVEAHGYVFSQREAAPASRSVSVPSPVNDTFSNITLASKGNTTYQKRLKMRCRNSSGMDSRSTEKTVTIGSSSGRLMYWGVEWSPRQHMITYINAARGSHNTQATGATGLPRYQDNEIWGFKPDLLLFELPIHNDGTDNLAARASGYWGRLTNNFVYRADYELSLKTRGAHFGCNPEIAMFTASIAWNFGGINDDGSLKTSIDLAGKVHTSLDRWSEAVQWVRENHPNDVIVHATQRWIDAGIAIHGDMKAATIGSGKGGYTFTNEGSHWNDTGSRIMAKCVIPVIDCTHGG
ncbi:MAG: hypothetical protein GXY45_11705 [Ramlibacter sp.]|nr:hypothetical protein [Ramlibacter sp.]